MNYKEAKLILHPDTSMLRLSEYEYYGGFRGKEYKMRAVEEACLVACEALERCIKEDGEEKMKKNNSVLICINTFEELKRFANIVTRFKEDINIYNGSDFYDAKSIMAVLALSLGQNRYVEIISNDEETVNEFKILMSSFEVER